MLIRLAYVACETIKEPRGPKRQSRVLRLGWGVLDKRQVIVLYMSLGYSVERERDGAVTGQSGLQHAARWRDCPWTFTLSRRLVHLLVPKSIQNNFLFAQHSFNGKNRFKHGWSLFRDVCT